MSSVSAVSDGTFEAEVLKSSRPVLVDFWAEWCGPCRQLAPTVDEVARENNEKLKVVKLDVDESPNTAAKYGVRGIPTLILFRDGEVVDSWVGNMPKQALVSKLSLHIGSTTADRGNSAKRTAES